MIRCKNRALRIIKKISGGGGVFNLILLDRLKAWHCLSKVESVQEKPEVLAGRTAELFLKTLVESHIKYKGCSCFIAKRVPSRQEGRRFEIDLIVLTKKRLHFLEVKNWSGQLNKKDGNWVQTRRNGKTVAHPNLTKYNSKKTDVMIKYLKSKGLNIDKSYFSQKVLFMNKNLTISNSILQDPDVIPIHKLDAFLESHPSLSFAAKMVHSIIEVCLESESGQIILDGLFKSLHSKQLEIATRAINELRSWDSLGLRGGRILKGDAIHLKIGNKELALNICHRETSFKVQWCRNKYWGLLMALINSPIGSIRIGDVCYDLDAKHDAIFFHVVGDTHPSLINLNSLDWFSLS